MGCNPPCSRDSKLDGLAWRSWIRDFNGGPGNDPAHVHFRKFRMSRKLGEADASGRGQGEGEFIGGQRCGDGGLPRRLIEGSPPITIREHKASFL